jgi:hypothetical protein
MASLPLLEATVRRLMGRPRSPPGSDSLWVYDLAPSEGRRTTPRAVRDRHQTLQPIRGLLTDAEIVRALRRFRYDRELRGPRRVPIRTLAEIVGLSHTTIYQAMRPDLPARPRKISETTRIKLSFVIKAISEGRLRFRRRGQVWDAEGATIWTFEPCHRQRITATY